MKFLIWLVSVFFAFNLGAGSQKVPTATDEELRGRVQEHIDVIVDESAAIVDEVTESLRENEQVQEMEKFLQDVREVTEETMDDLTQVAQDAKTRVEEKFGAGENPEGAQPEADPAAEEDADPADEGEADPEEIPAADPGVVVEVEAVPVPAEPTPAAPVAPDEEGING